MTHEFIYHYRKQENVVTHTEVKDCYGNKTIYKFDSQKRIRSITPYRGINEYVSDKVYWSDFGGLLAIRAIETNDEVLLCTQYQYDYNSGCPLGITYYGNLTGRGTSPIKIKDKKKVESEGERHTITSAYTLDRYHLKIEENDGQKIIKYRHYPDSDLVEAKFICSLDGTIRERSFFEYDVNAAVTLEINDDGSSQNREDLTAVTTRYIKRIQTSQVIPFGLPVDVKSYYFDLATGQERLLQHETRSYDRRGNLLQSDAYDADDQYIGTTHREYDNRNNLLLTRDIIGRETTQGYDGNNNLTHEKKPGCALTTREYDFSNRLIAEKVHLDNGMILTQRYQYDYLSRKTAEIDPQGQITRFAYDFLGRLVSSTQPTGEVSRIAYNKLSQPIEMIDGQGRKLCVEYTCRHKPTRMDYPNGTSEKWYYTLTGLLEEHIGITGIRTVYEYDYKSRCTRKTIHSATNADTLQHTWNYNAFHLLSETDATGITTTYEYDGAGRLVSTKSNGIEIRNEYNAKGLIFRTTEETEEGHVTIQVRDYDKVGRVVEEREEDAQGITLKRVRFAYDDQNHVIEKITEGNEVYRIEKTQYGPLGEILSQIDAEGNETRSVMDYQFYDETGRIVRREQKIDPQGNITEIRSDCKGKPIRTKFFNSMGVLLKESFNHYDSAENLILLEEYITTQGDNPRKVITKWEYDWFNRPTSRTDAVGTPEQKRTEICYNNYGQKECVIKPDGANIHFNYDGLGRLAKVESTDQTIQYQLLYDERGRLICVDEDNHSNYRQYDERNNLIGETLGNGLHIGCQYDAKGRPTLLQLPDRSTVTYQYDNHCLLKIQRYDEENNLKYQHDYLTFNADEKPLTMQLPANAGTVQAKYDALGRTVHIGHPKWNETIPQGGYDSIGNLKTLNIEDAEGTKTYNYAYDAQKQLIKENDHEYLWDSQYNCVRKDGVDQQHNDLNQLLSNGIENYQYDLNGNLLNKGNVAFSYDALDRLIKVESAELRFEYQYDFQNRRIAKRKYRNDDSQWTLHEQEKYIYVGDQEIGACNAENQIMQLRILGVGLGAEIGATIAIEVDDRIYAPVHNHIGHIMALIDTETGDVAQTYRYTAFGDELTQDVVNNPWKFASKRKDAETGFYNFGRRYYSPDMMRWLTADPIDRKGGPNIYAYVLNAPLTSFDLYGFVPMATLVDKNDFKQMTKLEQLKANMGIPIGGVSFLSMVLDIASALKSVTYNILTGTIQAGYGIGKIVGNVYRATEKSPTSNKGFTHVVGYESPKFIYIFHNGICNYYPDSFQSGELIGMLGHNVAVDITSQRTSGIIWDLFEVALLKMGFKTPAVYAAYNKMKEALDSDPEKMLAIFAHSKGTEIMYQAMKMLSKEERGRIHFAGFGGARMVEKGFCARVENYVSKRDSVPFLADPLAHFRSSKYEIKYRESKGNYFMDHALASDTYQLAIQDFHASLIEIQQGAK
jgi:RHS repeat-associated protein